MKNKIVIFYFFSIFFIVLCSYCIGRIDSTVLDGNFKTISPMDIATFEIKVTNNGNWDTDVTFTIESVPEGWSVYIENKIFIGKNSEKTVLLYVNPPQDFGYHNDFATFNMIINKNSSLSIYQNFLVFSKGFSIVGIERILPITLFIISIIIIVNLLYKKKFQRYFWQKR